MASVEEYQKRHIPWYLKSQRENGFLNRVMRWISFLRIDLTGKENLPDKGPFIVITNHFGGETPIILGLLSRYDVHIAASEEVNWKRSRLYAWIMRKLRMISVQDSLNLLSEKKKEELFKRTPKNRRRYYRAVLEKSFPADNRMFVEQSVALLSRGDVVVVYPEGLFLYGKKELHQGYRGIELVAKYYEELTGKQLPIVPVAIDAEEKNVRIGKPLLLSKNHTGLSGTDWCMAHLAQLFPENLRGYYKGTRL